MTKHTPGPWAVDPDDREGMGWNRHIVRADDSNMCICFMTSDGKEADAALIAAAPELLAALEQVVHEFQSGHSVCEDTKRMIIAAIAKCRDE